MSRVAIVGAGLAGLACASVVARAGHAVTLFDKSRGPGGRCATRRSDVGPFDHGAPGFEATTALFRAEVGRWQDAGWIDTVVKPAAGTTPDPAGLNPTGHRFIGRPSMNALARQLQAALPSGVLLRPDTAVAGLEWSAGSDGAWALRLLDGSVHPQPCDAVVVAIPAEQGAVLLAPDATLSSALRSVRSDPCWTLMAAWPNPLPALEDDLPDCRDPQGVLVRAFRDDVRPARPPVTGIGSRWVVHARAEWTVAHLALTPEQAAAALLDALAERIGARLARPLHAVVHRWLYAQVREPRSEPFGWNPALRLGTCGDAWHAANDADGRPAEGIERAWLSGQSLGRQLVADLPAA